MARKITLVCTFTSSSIQFYIDVSLKSSLLGENFNIQLGENFNILKHRVV